MNGTKNCFLRVNADFSLALGMKSCRIRSRNGWELRWITDFGYYYLRVAVVKIRKERRRITRVDYL